MPSPSTSRSRPLPLLSVQGNHFVNDAGNPVLLRGVNATGDAKVPPFKGITDIAQLHALKKLGFNCLRLLFIWEPFEPEPGQYNHAYLTDYEQVVQWAARAGLYVIVDFHQDAFSRYALGGCGEGFPRWAIDPSLPQYQPCNDGECAKWGLMATLYPTSKKENLAVWNSFHANVQNARTAFIHMASRVAKRLSGYRHVVGYDMINEPFGSDAQLSSLYTDMAAAIRAVHPQSILFVSTQALYSAAFGKPTLPCPNFDNFVFSAHYYDASVIILKKWLGIPPGFLLKNLLHTANRWEVPLFLAEFGAPANTWRGTAYMQSLYHWMDAHHISGTQWCYTPNWHPERKDGWNVEDLSIVDDTGTPRDNYIHPFEHATNMEKNT